MCYYRSLSYILFHIHVPVSSPVATTFNILSYSIMCMMCQWFMWMIWMLSVMIVIHLSSYLSIFPDYVMSFHPLSIRKPLSVFIFICIVLKKKKTWTVISILYKIRLLNQFTLWYDMHTYTKSCKLYEKGLSEFTAFISIRITFISSYYVLVHVSGLWYKYLSV